MKEDTLAILKQARELLSREGAWTQKAYARDAKGFPCFATEKCATCWCVYGAIQAAAESQGFNDINDATDVLRDVIGIFSISIWNDHPRRQVGSVLRAFNKAIKELEQGNG